MEWSGSGGQGSILGAGKDDDDDNATDNTQIWCGACITCVAAIWIRMGRSRSDQGPSLATPSSIQLRGMAWHGMAWGGVDVFLAFW